MSTSHSLRIAAQPEAEAEASESEPQFNWNNVELVDDIFSDDSQETMNQRISGRLDTAKTVQQWVQRDVRSGKNPPGSAQCALILYQISFCYSHILPSDSVDDLAELRVVQVALQESLRTDDFSQFLRLKILRDQSPSGPAPESSQVRSGVSSADEQQKKALGKSFRDTYLGGAVDGLYEYLTENNRKFAKKDTRGLNYYAQFCSIVQSSGTGKSRSMIELGTKGVIVLYLNMREREIGSSQYKEAISYPDRDEAVARMLFQGRSATALEYSARCCAFFTAIFSQLETWLTEKRKKLSYVAAVKLWHNTMSRLDSMERDAFLAGLERRFNEILNDNTVAQVSTGVANLSLDPEHTASGPESAAMQETPELKLAGAAAMRTAYRSLTETHRLFFLDAHEPKLVIALDEAHCLSRMTAGEEPYRPSHMLCRAISEYSRAHREPIWVVFASTNSRIADFSSPSHINDSIRVAVDGEQLFPPYTAMGWDQYADPLAKRVNASNVAQINHIVGYGRPLWQSLRSISDRDILQNYAAQKLCRDLRFDPRNSDQSLAVLAQRFGLDICFGHPKATEYLDTGVAGHMRVCVTTTEDRMWRFTTYPSEPFLSCVAAHLLHERDPTALVKALDSLKDKVDSGMIDIGQSGELLSRLLWLLAKDRCAFKTFKESTTRNGELRYCRSIPVKDFLEFFFGETFWPTDDDQKKEAQSAFASARINFSHWISMEENISSAGNEDWDPQEWILRHWYRTCAVQCCHGQPRIDKMIPIYFDDKVGKGEKDRVSSIFISDKAGENASPRDVSFIERANESIRCETARPYIAVTLDLGLQEEDVTSEFPTRSSDRINEGIDNRCLRIYARGMGATTFPFLTEVDGLLEAMRQIAARAKLPPNPNPIGARLQDLVCYGRTSSARHMRWEAGRDPKLLLSPEK